MGNMGILMLLILCCAVLAKKTRVYRNSDTTVSSDESANVEPSNAIIPVAAECKPDLQPVPFANNETPRSTIFFPSCTRVKRCGGCCGSGLLSCQPTASITKKFQVEVARYYPNGTVVEMEIIPLEEHTSCKCNCKIKPKDCTGRQVYIEDKCICGCPDIDAREKCRQIKKKLWDPSLCFCRCRAVLECDTGYYFDPFTCTCELDEEIDHL